MALLWPPPGVKAYAESASLDSQSEQVAKKGGRAVISDFINTRQYAAFFRARGWAVTTRWFPFDTFPPLRIVVVDKPAAAPLPAVPQT